MGALVGFGVDCRRVSLVWSLRGLDWPGVSIYCQVFLWVEFLGVASVCECVFICLGRGWAGMKSSTSVSDTMDPQPGKSDSQSDR